MHAQTNLNPMKKNGHNRRPSFGKIMPVSSILDNLMKSSLDQSMVTQPTTHNLRTIERSDADGFGSITDLTTNFINHEKLTTEQNKEHEATNKTFLKCVDYHHLNDLNSGDEGFDSTAIRNDDDDKYDANETIMSNGPNIVTHTICNNEEETLTENQTYDFQQPLSVLCEKLCGGSCNTSTKACQSIDLSTEPDIVTLKSQNKNDAKFPNKTIFLESNDNRHEFLTSMLENSSNDDDRNSATSMEINTSHNDNSCVPLTIENLKQFNEKFLLGKLAIAEALANTSAMTSPAAYRRLAARKIELSLNTPDFVYDVENAEYIPPRDLLMYLLRLERREFSEYML